MKTERDTFVEKLRDLNYFSHATKRWDEVDNRFEHDGVQTHWEMWEASVQREGYKLVPVDLIERCISHIGIASCHPSNNSEDDIQMNNDIDSLEKAMIGVSE